MRRYVVKREKARDWSLTAHYPDGSKATLGNYRSRGAARNVGMIMAGRTGVVEDAPKEEKPHAA